MCIFLNTKNIILIKKSNFRLRKTCVSYQLCDIFNRFRDRELNNVLLKTFLNERKWNIQDGGLEPEVDTTNDYFRFDTCLQRDSNIYTYVFVVSHTNGTCIYTVRLNWEKTGSEKSKMAAYTHEMRISHLPD